MNCNQCGTPMTPLDPREIPDPQPSRYVDRWRCDEPECPAQGEAVEDGGTNAPTFDENGHLATVIVDAKKLTELTGELVALRGQVADLERRGKLLRAVLDSARVFIDYASIIDLDPRLSEYATRLQDAIDGGALEAS